MLELAGISTFFLQDEYKDTVRSLMMQLKQKHYKGLTVAKHHVPSSHSAGSQNKTALIGKTAGLSVCGSATEILQRLR